MQSEITSPKHTWGTLVHKKTWNAFILHPTWETILHDRTALWFSYYNCDTYLSLSPSPKSTMKLKETQRFLSVAESGSCEHQLKWESMFLLRALSPSFLISLYLPVSPFFLLLKTNASSYNEWTKSDFWYSCQAFTKSMRKSFVFLLAKVCML